MSNTAHDESNYPIEVLMCVPAQMLAGRCARVHEQRLLSFRTCPVQGQICLAMAQEASAISRSRALTLSPRAAVHAAALKSNGQWP